MTKQQQIDLLQKKLNVANKHVADVDGVLKEQYLNIATSIINEITTWFKDCHDDYDTIRMASMEKSLKPTSASLMPCTSATP